MIRLWNCDIVNEIFINNSTSSINKLYYYGYNELKVTIIYLETDPKPGFESVTKPVIKD